MCGRFTLTTPSDELAAAFPEYVLPKNAEPRYNVAPGQHILVVPNLEDRRAVMYRWGLIPSWAKDPSIGHRMINARAETLAAKPSFRLPFKRRRCLILSDGFFEWKKEGTRRAPYYVRLKQSPPFAMAGLWERWKPPSGDDVLSCAIITTEANPLVRKIHDRMPVILHPEDYNLWLSSEPQVPYESLQKLLVPFPASEMEAYPVTVLVNSPSNDTPDCIVPVAGTNLNKEGSLF